MNFWNDAYRTRPPWEIGRPQPAFVELLRRGDLKQGSVLDVGCGTGENALFFAQNGFLVTGVDVAENALEVARSRSAERGLKVGFKQENALSLDFKGDDFDNVIDSGLFHTFSDEDRPIFTAEIARVLRSDGRYFMLCFSEKEPTGWGGPRRVTRKEIEDAFLPLFHINYIREELFQTRIHDRGGQAYLTSATKNLTPRLI